MEILISLLITVVIVGLIFFLIDRFLPEPFRKIGLAILAVIVIVYLIGLLTGHGPMSTLYIR